MRVGIVSCSHESNTFIPAPTRLSHFRGSEFLLGEEIEEKYGAAHHEVGGYFEVLREAGIEAVPIVFARTTPWGTVSDEALDEIWRLAEEGLKAAGKLDGILAANHGAGVNESRPDMDGWWLSNLRRLIGPDIPLVVTIDPHANLTPAMTEACEAVIAYRENPHLDQRQRGEEAARLMVRTLRGEIQPVTGASFPAIAMNIERQLTLAEPMLSVQRELEKTRNNPGILSASVTMGFPYADVPEMGSAFIVVADKDKALADREADRLGRWLVENREKFRGEMISPEDAVKTAIASPKPAGLLDMGDNMGGGAPGDSTVLPRLCLKHPGLKVFWYSPDQEAASAAIAAGVGARLKLPIGGKLPMSPEPPLELEVEVVSIHDGKYIETKPRHGGKMHGNMGPTAIVKTDAGFTIMLTSVRGGPNGSVQPILSCGLDPADFDILIIRGVHAPVGGYAEVCPTLIRVNTPGVTTADMDALEYHHRRRPLFPFEEIA